jgi:hypothetical protein
VGDVLVNIQTAPAHFSPYKHSKDKNYQIYISSIYQSPTSDRIAAPFATHRILAGLKYMVVHLQYLQTRRIEATSSFDSVSVTKGVRDL